MRDKLDVLLLSSRMPSHSANLVGDMITSLQQAGHHVQFGVDGIDKVIGDIVKPRKYSFFEKFDRKIYNVVRRTLKGRINLNPHRLGYWSDKNLLIFHPFEERPPYPAGKLVSRIKGSFDICIVVFWQDLITAKTLKRVYEKLHCPIAVVAVDMMPFTGGCYYFGDCRNFEHECGMCPVLGGKNRNDRTHRNFLYKKKVYDSIECTLLANAWQMRFALGSKMFENARTRLMSFILDENEFKPRDVKRCREKLGVPEYKKFIFLARYRNLARKGMDILIDGVNTFWDAVDEEKRRASLLLLIGDKMDDPGIIRMDVMQLGVLGKNDLIDSYCASTAFLCSSTEDAGPSMVNQSMACGTPVIAFDSGSSMEMISDGTDGYKVPLTDRGHWKDGLFRITSLEDSEYEAMRLRAREKAVALNGLKAFSTTIENVYKDFRPNGKKQG